MPSSLFFKITYGTLAIGIFLGSAEISCRVDNWIQLGIPIMATPDHQRDLTLSDAFGTRGKPNGRYKKWRLNQFGFRGPEIHLDPTAECTRIIVLGASEIFGLYESERKEVPAKLASALNQGGCYEVVNAAMPGMTVKTMVHYWEAWCARFRPSIVVVYPSPLFYLSESPPPRTAPKIMATPSPQSEATPIGSRLLFQMRDVIDFPDFIQRKRNDRIMAARTSGKSEDWLFRVLPQDRIDLFSADLAELVASIRAYGSQPILLTHAVRSAIPPRPADFDDLHSARVHVPRATTAAIVAFEVAASQATIALGASQALEVIDVAGVMNGKREWFADLVHFNDSGAAVIANLVAERIKSLSHNTGNRVKLVGQSG
jgi:hypothetical protein